MIYINLSTTSLYPNLYEQGEALAGSQTYTLKFTGIEITQTITDSQEANVRQQRFFRFRLPTLTSTKDGYYNFTIEKDGNEIYSELAYIELKSANTYNENTITNTYAANGTL